jgi:hypothetical protein
MVIPNHSALKKGTLVPHLHPVFCYTVVMSALLLTDDYLVALVQQNAAMTPTIAAATNLYCRRTPSPGGGGKAY